MTYPFLACILVLPTVALSQNQVRCGSELRNKIDEKQLALQWARSVSWERRLLFTDF